MASALRQRWPHALAAGGAVLGATLAALSTYDFARHLDRQVHALHCGFGGGGPNAVSGCKVAMMSSYSSVLRGSVWGGVPIALPAMAWFAFLAFAVVEAWTTGRDRDKRATLLLAIAAALPVLASLVMATISLASLGTLCAVCVGIYISSGMCFAGALVLWLRARRQPADPVSSAQVAARAAGRAESAVGAGARPASVGYLAAMSGVAFAFVVATLTIYLVAAPDQSRYVAGCGQLESSRDRYKVLVPFVGVDSGIPGTPGVQDAIEVLDPLCPACAAFEQRLHASGIAKRLARRVVLFPLDSKCNWMVDRTLHPGACTVSEAVLCAKQRASEVIRWALASHARILEATRADAGAAKRMVVARFPSLARCVGSARARARLNRALRWAVHNHLPVLTPQLFIGGVKVCNEDLDLGLDYTVSRMLARAKRSKGARR